MSILSSSTLRKSAGFTLIELLVVIAIIAVLSTIGLSAFTSAQARARDARRMGDMKAISDSFEQYNSANGTYASTATMANSLPGSIMPSDPRPVATYPNQYSYSTSNLAVNPITWCACAYLESVGKGNASTPCANGVVATWASGGQYFCVRNLQ